MNLREQTCLRMIVRYNDRATDYTDESRDLDGGRFWYLRICSLKPYSFTVLGSSVMSMLLALKCKDTREEGR